MKACWSGATRQEATASPQRKWCLAIRRGQQFRHTNQGLLRSGRNRSSKQENRQKGTRDQQRTATTTTQVPYPRFYWRNRRFLKPDFTRPAARLHPNGPPTENKTKVLFCYLWLSLGTASTEGYLTWEGWRLPINFQSHLVGIVIRVSSKQNSIIR